MFVFAEKIHAFLPATVRGTCFLQSLQNWGRVNPPLLDKVPLRCSTKVKTEMEDGLHVLRVEGLDL